MNRKVNVIFAIATAIVCIAASAHAQALDTSNLPMPIEGASGMTMDEMDAAVLSLYTGENGYTVLFPAESAPAPSGSVSVASFSGLTPPPPIPSSFTMFLPATGDGTVDLATPPNVPEPCSMLVLASGVAGLFLKRKQ